ncbi:hypothetical protein [uncultured Pseudodesulfovibrio sp.]|uniref:hypothetical protein n=1 Tax=uncultured Pseudodesulfovibrio sp. TaxID=2035858 RepID=UPI0029C61080|nr:hypothetical protein [uncultured Pseudodesulfovibrio sp.]
MYKIVLNISTLVILILFSNHVRETVVQGQNLVFAVGYTALFSLELPLCFLYFRTKRAVFGKALGWLLALHVLYPAYLAVSLAVVAPESLSTPYGAGMLLFVLVVFADAASLIRQSRGVAVAADAWTWYCVLFLLTYTPLAYLIAFTSHDATGLANDYTWLLYFVLAVFLASMLRDKALAIVAPATALFSAVYLATHFLGAPYRGRFVPVLLTAHGAYVALFAVVWLAKRRMERGD